MSKFKLTEDLLILDKVILPKGSIISFNEYDEIKVSTEFGPITFTPDMLKDKIELFTEELEVKVSVLDDEDEEVIKNYRLQLDVKTSRRKVRDIESFLRKTLQEML
jgi:hypothetical protein